MTYTLHMGDCLEYMRSMKGNSVDAVITDPPYMIGAKSVGDPKAKTGGWPDMMNAAVWYGEWYAECWRILKDTGYLLSFGNWRSLPTMMKAFAAKHIPIDSVMVWDKE